MKTRVMCILDKTFPPNHSFVDGMLSTVLPSKDIKVFLVVSKGKSKEIIQKYNKSIAIPKLHERKGLKRFWNFAVLYVLLYRLLKKNKKTSRIVLFIRNEPIYLLVASLFRKKVDKIIYQQSFPHELGNNQYLKKKVAILIFRLAKKNVDGLVTVSPRALKRLKSYFPSTREGLFIPLLTNKKELSTSENIKKINKDEPIKFIYIGTHDSSRKLEVVILGIKKALTEKINATFTFIGGTEKEVKNIREQVDISMFEKQGLIEFIGKIPRNELLEKIKNYDVGISLIPNNEIYVESSPTKLVEYMSKGLMVLASRGIDLQEKFINESNGGLLTDFSVDEISKSIISICRNVDSINIMKQNALKYAANQLLYENYLDQFRKML